MIKSLLLSAAVFKLVDADIIWSNSPSGYNACAKVTRVFGITVCVTSAAYNQNRAKCDHVVNVFYQLLDNDADGVPDDTAVHSHMVNKNYLLYVPNTRQESEPDEDSWPDNVEDSQMTGIFETFPNSCYIPVNRGASPTDRLTWPGARDTSNESCTNERDATTEEVLHLITVAAARLYPEKWGESFSSEAGVAMEAANGDCGWGYQGNWIDPSSNGCSGRYAYNDETCRESCLVVEGIYWASVAYIGGLYTKRAASDISSEWLMATPDANMALEPTGVSNAQSLQSGSPALYALVSDTTSTGHAWLPDIHPDGKYQGFDAPSPPTYPPNNSPSKSPNNSPTTTPEDGCNPACGSGEFCNFDPGTSSCEECPDGESCTGIGLISEQGEEDCQQVCEQSEDPEDPEEPTCIDSPLLMIIGQKVKDCEWVGEKPNKRCQKKQVASHCPLTCNKCDMFQCKDSQRRFKYEDRGRKCRFFQRNQDRCDDEDASETCRATCGYCSADRAWWE